jgi:hypothetical protein
VAEAMPFTPFHFGPALLLKSLAPRQFSFSAFVASQVAIDLETLYWLAQHEWPVHRVLHTCLVGAIVGTAVGVAMSLVAQPFTRRIRELAQDNHLSAEVRLGPAIAGGLVGGLSHAVLDGIMHRDVQPFRPITGRNPLLGIIDVRYLHLACVAAGLVGLILLAGRSVRKGAG